MRGITSPIRIGWYRDNIWGKPCHYCGLPTDGGIDRVDSSGSYETGNCVPCCRNCNRIKFIHSPEKFVVRVREIVRRWDLV